MTAKKAIAKILYKAMSNEKISFSTAVRLYDYLDIYLARGSAPSKQFANKLINKHMIKASKCAWTSVLFPAEILLPFKISPMTLEVIAGLFSTLSLSKALLDKADELSIPLTMCSFHRMLIGLSKARFLRKPFIVAATSILCDGNLKSFSEVAGEQGVPLIFIDIPFNDSGDGIKYVKEQLESACHKLSEITKITDYRDKLRESAANANNAFSLMRRFYDLRRNSSKNLFQGYEISNFAFPNHFMLGGTELMDILEARCRDIESGRRRNLFFKSLHFSKDVRRLMWLHIVPQYDTPIWKIVDNGDTARIVCDEYSSPYFEDYNVSDPLGSIAKRLIRHPGNGPIERRIDHILRVARDFNVDGIIHYSSWGCHQAAGNVHLLGNTLQKNGFNFININGDAANPDNSPIEQHRTRLEAFLEDTTHGSTGSP